MLILSDLRKQFLEIVNSAPNECSEELIQFTGTLIDSFEFLRTSANDRLNNLSALYKASVDFAKVLDPSAVLNLLVNLVAEQVCVKRCSIFVLDQSDNVLYMKYHVGFDLPDKEIPKVKIGDGIVGTVAGSRKVMRVDDIESDSRIQQTASERYYNSSFICMPLFAHESVVGVINVSDKLDGTIFTEADEELLTIIAGIAGTSLENAQLYKQMDEKNTFIDIVLQNISYGIWVLNRKGELILTNRRMRFFLDKEEGDVIEKPFTELLPPALKKAFDNLVKETMEKGGVTGYEFDWRLHPDKTLPLEMNTVLLRGSDADIIGILGIWRDMSESRELDKLRELDTMKTNFIATISHELRTPLTSMKASIGLLHDEMIAPLTEKQKNLTAILKRNSERLLYLINNLLDLSRLESGKTELMLEPVNIREMIEGVIEEMKNGAEQKEVNLTLKDAPNEKFILDERKMEQVLLNIIGNGLKFTPSGGKVEVFAEICKNNLIIKVSDTGIGLSEKERVKIFNKFYQVEEAMTRKYQGSGLGLAICKSIIELHLGEISVESKQGKGSTFIIEIPKNDTNVN